MFFFYYSKCQAVRSSQALLLEVSPALFCLFLTHHMIPFNNKNKQKRKNDKKPQKTSQPRIHVIFLLGIVE